MIYEAQYLVREHKKLLNEAKKPSQKTHVVWELYCGKGRLSDYVNTLPGCRAEMSKAGTSADLQIEEPFFDGCERRSLMTS